MSATLEDGPTGTDTDDEPVDVITIELDGCPCRLVRVTGVVPRHAPARNGVRPRLLYMPGEVAHFDLGGHRYAVVPAEPASGHAPPREEGGVASQVHELLTNRELQIVQLICMGCLTKQVADRLRISEFTVRSYLKTIYCKLGVRSRGAMVFRYAQAFKGHPARG
jgi:DNA-binding CsgD family transcriptional regulator